METDPLLVSGDAFAAVPFARFGELGQDVLRGDISGSQHAQPDGQGRPIPSKPFTRSRQHLLPALAVADLNIIVRDRSWQLESRFGIQET